MCRFASGSALLVCLLLAPTATFAQASIVGAVKDTSGAVLPGVSAGGLRVRGVGDSRMLMAGVTTNTSYRVLTGAYNLAAYQEVVVDTGGIGAEQEEGGVRVNIIPRDGGNTFSGTSFFAFANKSTAGHNLTQSLMDRGLRAPDSLKQILDINPGFGGPIKRDKIWFNGAARYARAWNYVPTFFNKNAGNANVWTYEADLARDAASNEGTIRN